MKKRYVIARKYLPTRPMNVLQIATIATLLHYWQAPEWLCGIVWTVTVISFISSWALLFVEVDVKPSEAEAKQ